MKRIFIAGCGYIGERIAAIAAKHGVPVTCTVRSAEHELRLKQCGYAAIQASCDSSAEIPAIDVAAATLFYLIPPPGGGIVDSRARNFIERLSHGEKPAAIIYMSATSVYSESGGASVTERSPAEPDSAMGKRRLDAESAFRAYGRTHNVPVIILRVSGIYGPGRLPLMQISQRQPLLNEKESGPSNRIHADDLATVCIAAAEHGSDGDIFNVSDGSPSSMTHYFNACATALGMPLQPQVSMDEARLTMSPLMFSYASQSRIVDNSLMLERLGITLRYPLLEEGIAASVIVPS